MTEPTAIRDAITARLPSDPAMVRDVKVNDGLVDISVQCGALRFAGVYGIGDRSPDQMADIAAEGFRTWAMMTAETIFGPNFMDQPNSQLEETFGHYHRAGRGFRQWFLKDPHARDWLAGEVDVPELAA